MELGPAADVFQAPHHPYTEALLSAVPTLDGLQSERIRLGGEIPSAADPSSGCVFHTRCPRRLGGDLRDDRTSNARRRSRSHDPLPHPSDTLRRLQDGEQPAEGRPEIRA